MTPADGGPLDVLVVGAGPTGLTLAAQLQACGATVRIVDRSWTACTNPVLWPSNRAPWKFCADSASPRSCWSVATTRSGSSSTPAAASSGSGCSGSAWTTPPTRSCCLSPKPRPNRCSTTTWPPGACGSSGAWSWPPSPPTPTASAVLCATVTGGPSRCPPGTWWAAMAPEAPSVVGRGSRSAAAPTPRPSPSPTWRSTAVWTATPPTRGSARSAWCSCSHWAGPPAGGCSACTPTLQGRGEPARPSLAELQALADTFTGGRLRLRDPVWLTYFRLAHRHAARYRAGRVFLAGDAAHVHSPAGAQGMNTGIQDAWNLGWKLALAARGLAEEALLDSYNAERRPVGRYVVRFTDRAFARAPS